MKLQRNFSENVYIILERNANSFGEKIELTYFMYNKIRAECYLYHFKDVDCECLITKELGLEYEWTFDCTSVIQKKFLHFINFWFYYLDEFSKKSEQKKSNHQEIKNDENS